MKIVINYRKSSLFYGNEKGATGSCIITSVVQTAKANKLKVEEYVTYVFKYLSSHFEATDDELEKLMPWSDEMKE
ncbi:MAG: transposase domain-containing protein [Coprobacillus cateniformis]|nr:transposase domain-containing protein [Coprobacillus cateniformis]